jgi:hypothetical protein
VAVSLRARTRNSSPLTAIRTEPAIVATLLEAAGLAWWSTAERMAGMDAGPGTALGSVGWFTGVWVTMMAAMMLPSLAPAAAVFAPSVRRELSRVLLFAGGYLLIWGVAGIGAYGLFELGKSLCAGSLAWHAGGRWLAAGVLALAGSSESRRRPSRSYSDDGCSRPEDTGST